MPPIDFSRGADSEGERRLCVPAPRDSAAQSHSAQESPMAPIDKASAVGAAGEPRPRKALHSSLPAGCDKRHKAASDEGDDMHLVGLSARVMLPYRKLKFGEHRASVGGKRLSEPGADGARWRAIELKCH